MRKYIIITALIFMMGVIFYMSAQPAEESSGMSDKVCRIICEIFVPGRSYELRDVLIDSAGVLAGVMIIWMLRKKQTRVKS